MALCNVSDAQFCLSYYGTIGLSQDIGNTLEYARTIASFFDRFQYAIIGEGAKRDDLIARSKNPVYSFVQIRPAISPEQLDAEYLKTNLSIVSLKKSSHFQYTIPSKLFQIMAHGVAVLLIGPEGEAAGIVREYCAGLALTSDPQEDLIMLSAFFRRKDWREQLIRMGMLGREAVKKEYNRQVLAQRYLELLQSAKAK